MDREQLAEHLQFALELGVRGISRDAAWRTRVAPVSVAPAESNEPAALDAAAAAATAVHATFMEAVPPTVNTTPVTIHANRADALAAVPVPL